MTGYASADLTLPLHKQKHDKSKKDKTSGSGEEGNSLGKMLKSPSRGRFKKPKKESKEPKDKAVEPIAEDAAEGGQ